MSCFVSVKMRLLQSLDFTGICFLHLEFSVVCFRLVLIKSMFMSSIESIKSICTGDYLMVTSTFSRVRLRKGSNRVDEAPYPARVKMLFTHKNNMIREKKENNRFVLGGEKAAPHAWLSSDH